MQQQREQQLGTGADERMQQWVNTLVNTGSGMELRRPASSSLTSRVGRRPKLSASATTLKAFKYCPDTPYADSSASKCCSWKRPSNS